MLVVTEQISEIKKSRKKLILQDFYEVLKLTAN